MICVRREDQGNVLRYGGDGNSEGKVLYVDKTRSLCNSGKLLLVPYTKDFGIITRF